MTQQADVGKDWKAELGDTLRLFRQPESVAFAVLVSLATWASVLAPRVLGIVMPVAAACAFIGATRFRQRMRMPAMDSEIWWVWAVVVSLVGVSATWSPDYAYGLERSAKIASSFAMGIFLYFLASELFVVHRAQLRRLLLASFIFAVLLIAVYMLSDDVVVRRVMGGSDLDDAAVGANRAAVVLATLLWPTLLAAIEAGHRRVAWALPFVTLAAVSLTYSQTAPVAILAGLIVLVVAHLLPRAALWLVALGGVALVLLMPFFFLNTCPALLQENISWAAAAAAGERIEIWCAVSARVPDDIFFGHGIEAARFVNDWGMEHIYFKPDGILHPHNAALQVWYEFGATGAFIASLIWCGLVWRIAYLGPQARAICLASIAGIVTVACISHGLWQSWWLGTVGIVPALFRMIAGPVWFKAREVLP
ncbi:MAG: O-antigen ligase family protein [Parvibaculum sp.]|nr:O-antigen ligase family protein [Parvibaculum sp.]